MLIEVGKFLWDKLDERYKITDKAKDIIKDTMKDNPSLCIIIGAGVVETALIYDHCDYGIDISGGFSIKFLDEKENEKMGTDNNFRELGTGNWGIGIGELIGKLGELGFGDEFIFPIFPLLYITYITRFNDEKKKVINENTRYYKINRKNGWYLVVAKGSHRQYKHQSKSGRVMIAGYPNDDLAPGTLNSILKQANLKEVK